MGKSENTLVALEAALDRIANGKPKHIPKSRKLSVRAVEEEAKLGNSSGYYYPEFVEKVKQTKADIVKWKDVSSTLTNVCLGVAYLISRRGYIKPSLSSKNSQIIMGVFIVLITTALYSI